MSRNLKVGDKLEYIPGSTIGNKQLNSQNPVVVKRINLDGTCDVVYKTKIEGHKKWKHHKTNCLITLLVSNYRIIDNLSERLKRL